MKGQRSSFPFNLPVNQPAIVILCYEFTPSKIILVWYPYSPFMLEGSGHEALILLTSGMSMEP